MQDEKSDFLNDRLLEQEIDFYSITRCHIKTWRNNDIIENVIAQCNIPVFMYIYSEKTLQ